MKSMTGFGTGLATRPPWRCEVEVHSVNRKQLDIVVSLPKNLVSLERSVRQLVQESASRGRISVKVSLEAEATAEQDLSQLKVCGSLARAYAREYEKLFEQFGVLPLAPLDLLRAPGVFELVEGEIEASSVWPVIEEAARAALEAFTASRQDEGGALRKVLAEGRERLRELIGAMRERAPEVRRRYRDNLRVRLEEAGLPLPLEDERLVREIGLFAERSDITEELDRLESHDQQWAQYLGSDLPMGRPLDFLAQELNRELNTIGSKANDASLTQLVVQAKAEVEKLREQVQNIE